MTWSSTSRRSVPTNRSAYPFCQGDRGAILICSNAEVAHARIECPAADLVPITDHPDDPRIDADNLDDLLGRPELVGIRGDVHVQELPPLEREHEEHVQQVEPHRRHDEEIDGDGAREVRPSCAKTAPRSITLRSAYRS